MFKGASRYSNPQTPNLCRMTKYDIVNIVETTYRLPSIVNNPLT